MQSLNRPSGDDAAELHHYLRNGVIENKLAAITSLKTAAENIEPQAQGKSIESSFEIPSPIPHIPEPNGFLSIHLDNEQFSRDLMSPP